MIGISILFDSVNFTIIKDNQTGYIWLYSHKKPIAYYDKEKVMICKGVDDKGKNHISVFKKKLKNNEL